MMWGDERRSRWTGVNNAGSACEVDREDFWPGRTLRCKRKRGVKQVAAFCGCAGTVGSGSKFETRIVDHEKNNPKKGFQLRDRQFCAQHLRNPSGRSSASLGTIGCNYTAIWVGFEVAFQLLHSHVIGPHH